MEIERMKYNKVIIVLLDILYWNTVKFIREVNGMVTKLVNNMLIPLHCIAME